MSWASVAVGVGLTATKMIGDAQREKTTKTIRAAQERYSPWTKMTPDEKVQYADPAGAVAQGVGAGFSTYQGIQNADLNKQIVENMKNRPYYVPNVSVNTSSNPWGLGNGSNGGNFWPSNPYSS